MLGNAMFPLKLDQTPGSGNVRGAPGSNTVHDRSASVDSSGT